MTTIALAIVFTGWGAALVTFALKFASAEKRAAEQNGRAQVLDVNLTSLAAQLADVTNKAREEEERGDRLDDLFAKVLVRAAGPVRGSYDELLQEVRDYYAKRGDGSTEVHQPASAGTAGPDELLKPGE